MKFDSDERMIKEALDSIKTPEYNIRLDVEKRMSKAPAGYRRAVPAVLAACLVLIFSIGVAAAAIPGVNNLLAIVSPEMASRLQPVNVASEDNGIRMEVVAAMNDGEMAVIYVTMQDLTGNRIDQTMDLYDYSLTGTRMFNSQIVHYEHTTKTATLRIQADGGDKLNGKKVSFRIDSFLSGRSEFDAIDTGINLSALDKTAGSQTVPLKMNNSPGGGGSLFSKLWSQGTLNVLKTDQMNISFPGIEFMSISNMGYVEDRLHIQTKWVGDGVDDHGYFYFVDSMGNLIDVDEGNIYFGTDESGNPKYGREYVEYIFDIHGLDLNEVKLMGCFVTNNNFTTGNWRTTFRLQSVEEEKNRECHLEFDTWTAYSISVSPVGITLFGRGEVIDLSRITIGACMIDGSVQTFDSVSGYGRGKDIKVKFTSFLPLDVSKVETVTVNDHVVRFD